MAARMDAMASNAGTRTDITDMSARPDAIPAADMGTNANTQNIDTKADTIGIGRATEQRRNSNSREQDFHALLPHDLELRISFGVLFGTNE